MIQAFNAWLNVPHEKVVVISRIVSMLHSASLMSAAWLCFKRLVSNIVCRVDDVEDDSRLRRGIPGEMPLPGT